MFGNRTIILLLLIWYFAARVDHELSGVDIRVIVGPFPSAAICEKYRLETITGFLESRMTFDITPSCIQKEAI